jgi:HEAT repeat protein
MIAMFLVAMLGGATPTVWADASPVAALLAEAPQDSLYKQGTGAIDRGDWDAAVKAFGELAKQKGERADAALYWQAYALYKGGQSDAALKTCAALKSTYPQSRWQRDRRALELEIRQATGQAPRVEADDSDELKLMALSGLMNADPSRALPLIKQILDSASSSDKVRDRALFVLAQSGSPEARQTLVAMARSDANPDLQARAIQNLGLFGGHESRQSLIEIYSTSQNMQARKAVLGALMLSGDRSGLAEVARKETSPELRREAINQLGVSGGRDELWQMYQQEKDDDTKRAIMNALFVGGGHEQLTQLATKEADPDLRREAIEKLGLTGQQSAPTLKTIYATDKDPAIKRAVLNAFFVQGNAKALIEVARQEKDAGLKREAIEKLSVMGSKEATDYFLELLK